MNMSAYLMMHISHNGSEFEYLYLNFYVVNIVLNIELFQIKLIQLIFNLFQTIATIMKLLAQMKRIYLYSCLIAWW